MTCRGLVIYELEEGGEQMNSDDRVFARRCRSESIFPMYAMGKSKSNSLSRTIIDNAGDPIWDSVRADARSEVVFLLVHFSLNSLFVRETTDFGAEWEVLISF